MKNITITGDLVNKHITIAFNDHADIFIFTEDDYQLILKQKLDR